MIFAETWLQVVEGRKTVTRRITKVGKPSKYKVGHSYSVQPGRTAKGIARIDILSARQEPLGYLSVEEAKKEGYDTAADFELVWIKMYGSYDPAMLVWRYEFKLIEVNSSAVDY